MLETITDLPKGIEGVKAVGEVSKEDYEHAFVPMLARARREGRRIRVLYQIGPEFRTITPGAAWEDAKSGLRSIQIFDGCAVVTDVGRVIVALRAVSRAHRRFRADHARAMCTT